MAGPGAGRVQLDSTCGSCNTELPNLQTTRNKMAENVSFKVFLKDAKNGGENEVRRFVVDRKDCWQKRL